MPNNRFNKQVTPKGYKMGGKVMGDRVGFDKGMRVKETGFKHKGRLKKLYKEIVGRDRKFRDPKDALMALTRADVGVKFLDGLEKKGIDADKIRKDILKEKMKSTEFRIGTAKGKSKASDDDEKKYRVYKKGGSVRDTRKTEQMIGASISSKREKGRARKMGGGMMMQRPMMQEGGRAKMPMKKAKDTPSPQFTKKGLRPVKPSQKGLKKLPTEVRNKMGYMKKGGKVHGK